MAFPTFSVSFDESSDFDAKFKNFNVIESPPEHDHTKLINRDANDQHPMHAITGLRPELVNIQTELTKKVDTSNILSNTEIQDILNS